MHGNWKKNPALPAGIPEQCEPREIDPEEMKARIAKLMTGLSERAAVSDDQSRAWDYENIVIPHLEASQLPPAFWGRIVNWHPEQRAVYDQCVQKLNGTGAIVVLVGPRGTGKTSIAAQLILDRAWDDSIALPWHRRPPYRKASQLLQRFKSLYSDFGSRNGEELMERFSSYCSMHLLFVIDEWHECEDFKAHDRMMTDFIDRRYSHNNDTLIISNETPEQFMQSTNESTLSRMQESGGIISCDWQSFR